MLILIVVLLAFVYLRQASPTQEQVQRPPAPTAVVNGSRDSTNQSSVNDDQFYALLATINRGLDDATDVIKTAVQKN